MTLGAAVKRHLGALKEAAETIEARAGAQGVGADPRRSRPTPAKRTPTPR